MQINAKNRLQASTELTAATAKEAVAYLTQTFNKHGLAIKIKAKSDTELKCTQKTPFGLVEFDLELNWKKSGVTMIEVGFVSAKPLSFEALHGDEDIKVTKLGKKGLKEFGKFARGFAKEANDTRDQLVFAGEWIMKFAAALQEIDAAMSDNKTKVGKEFR